AEQTGKSIEQLTLDMERDFYMSAEEAKEYGIVDNVMTSSKKGASA
ncbi:MAG TPA: ATP-dependent Clp protease proteolytic subunit, partial [Treponema sp.]|nr:ATP-dependent Clp protease proteolytic subunit [Treponema sp.]